MLVIFDVDGTLLDTYKLIEETYIHVFKKYLPDYKYTKEEIKSFFGPALEDTFMWVTHDEEKTSFLVKKYHEFNLSHHKDYLNIYPHVKETLQELKKRGHKLGVVSNKDREAIELGFNIMKIREYFDMIVGLDEVVNPKPNPEGINKIRSQFPKMETAMVGDTVFDVQTARNAGVTSIACTYALTKKEDFEEIKPDYIIDDFQELLEIIK